MSLSISGSSGFLQAQQAMFAKLDLNTDGALDADEFSALGQNLPAQGGARPLKGGGGSQSFSPEALGALLGAQEMSQSDRAAEMFANVDTDGDGALSAEEFTALKAPQGGPTPGGRPPPSAAPASGEAEYETTYDAADTDKDGTVSMSELLASLQSSSDVASGISSEVSNLMAKLLETLQGEVDASKEGVTA